MEEGYKIALLIDAENISSSYLKAMFDKLSKYGVVTYKRVYGDWTSPNMSKWRTAMIDYALSPIQQFQNTKNKNSSDSTLIIDAMDILYSGSVNAFCIVSSDSDFTRLITRIREDGNFVIGMGERKAPASIVKVCDKYFYLDVTDEEKTEEVKKIVNSMNVSTPNKKSNSTRKTRPLEKVKINDTLKIIAELCDEDGYANFSEVYNRLIKIHSDMDAGNYGYSKSSDLFKDCKAFEMKKEQAKQNKLVHHYYIKSRK